MTCPALPPEHLMLPQSMQSQASNIDLEIRGSHISQQFESLFFGNFALVLVALPAELVTLPLEVGARFHLMVEELSGSYGADGIAL